MLNFVLFLMEVIIVVTSWEVGKFAYNILFDKVEDDLSK